MIQLETARRSWAGMVWLLVIAALLVALAVGNTFVLLSTLAMAAVVGWLLLRRQASALASAPSVSVDAARAPRTQRSITAADGVVRQALVVPAAAVDGYQAVLTVDGYVLVNAEGRAVYVLNRQPQIQPSESEPVMVTILDAEMAA